MEEAPPIIDISGTRRSHLDTGMPFLTCLSPAFYGKDDTAKQNLVEQVCSACTTFGFLQIVNHNIPDSLQEDILRQSKEFFNLPPETKEKYNKGKNKSSKFDGAWRPLKDTMLMRQLNRYWWPSPRI
jgi:isopenicillin N synthase-like dioxygenase